MSIKILPHLSRQRPMYIIGLNSGTSADGLDMVLAKFAPSKRPEILKYKSYNFPENQRNRIISLGEPEFVNGIEWMALDSELGESFGHSIELFVSKIEKDGGKVDLIGSHGQTVRHLPTECNKPLTLQAGDPSIIARISGLPVVADFRRSDIAAGGEGAPLSPILHEALFRDKNKWRAIVNIGGIANITILPPLRSDKKPLAGDSGPGNMAVDMAMNTLFGRPYDLNGNTARMGSPVTAYINETLDRPFFLLKPPKSTGRELFGSSFFKRSVSALANKPPEDIVATLSEISIQSIAGFIHRFGRKVDEIYLCGGGAKNNYFLGRLKQLLQGSHIETTAALGYNPDYLEALLWAYLAYCFISENRIEARNFTGARKSYIPGRLCLP